jgi:hypothetical protein
MCITICIRIQKYSHRRVFLGIYKPNSVLRREIDIYLGCLSPNTSSGTPHIACALRGTALHSRKNFAVSAGLNRIVSVLISMVTHDRRYLLRVSLEAHVRLERMNVRTFLTSSRHRRDGRVYPMPYI